MSFFASSSIKVRLMACFGLVMVLSLIVSGLSINAMYSSISTATRVSEIITGNYRRIALTSTTFESTNAAIINYLTPNNQTPANMQKVNEEMDKFITSTKALGGRLGLKEIVFALKDQALEYERIFENDVMSLINAGRPYEALEVYLNVLAPLSTTMRAEIEKVVALRFIVIEDLSEELVQTGSLIMVISLTTIQLIVSIIIALVISSSIQRAIKAQCTAAQALSNGEFNYRFAPSSKDEFGVLNNAMISMAAKLRETIAHVITLADKVNADMSDMEKSAQNICEAMERTERKAIAVSASADEMVATTTNIANNCKDAAASSQESADLTSVGMKSVNESTNAIRDQYEHMKQNASTIQSLVDQALKIGSIVGTIDEIAAQTNLLALNAAIEAARAGEAGRGFAVVADEVRALANRTTASTQEIRGMVDRIQIETAHATEAMQQNLDSMSEVASSSSGVQENLSNALNFVNDVNTQITQISSAASQQTTASSEISNNMQDITHAATEVNNVAQNARTTFVGTADSLNDLIDRLKFFKI
ncbi:MULTISPECIES: methyl-accepting chemotaxis protein [unclassified Anaerobiospirillum]|uniref:methyl-accepting chemotaxis protein n=1 Tax=unclassified Anaerobiospirillum TaxID=2647410 RepID=UPI001FF16764|nr:MULTISPECIES: methyl-accepting chemotaxis protein [unclassified Anaerobiospirillum]MCK0535258.1 methyl-accepting chemotaxis protein [Anaerobiospirillum sp. NML120511]MCK0540430.1 methyl-accepting chemotaxis protein [Anaerobiospirillum sp. NML02-A-032]